MNPTRYLVVAHDEVWTELVRFFDGRDVDLMPLPPMDDEPNGEQGVFHILVPRNMGPS